MLDKILSLVFGGSQDSVRITKEQRAELEAIENKAYMDKAKDLAKKKGEILANKRFDELTKSK